MYNRRWTNIRKPHTTLSIVCSIHKYYTQLGIICISTTTGYMSSTRLRIRIHFTMFVLPFILDSFSFRFKSRHSFLDSPFFFCVQQLGRCRGGTWWSALQTRLTMHNDVSMRDSLCATLPAGSADVVNNVCTRWVHTCPHTYIRTLHTCYTYACPHTYAYIRISSIYRSLDYEISTLLRTASSRHLSLNLASTIGQW